MKILQNKTIYELTLYLHDSLNGELEFISGKWFRKGIEIKNIRKYLYVTGLFKSIEQLDKVIDSYIVMYGTTKKWYDLPIIREAKEQQNLQPLCYPLNEKQLMIINYLLRHDEEVFFILTGVGGSGKSTFANIICEIFDKDVAPLNLSDLSDDFKLATGIDKRLIYSTEINSDEINNGVLKQLFSNEEITINPKFQKPYKARCQSAFIFNCNIPPRLDLSDSGMLRRILYYSMNEKIEHPNPELNKKEWKHSDLVNIVAHALKVDMTNWKENFKEDTRYNLLKYNSVFRFKDVENYGVYMDKCKSDGLKPFARPKWEEIRLLLQEWGYISESTPIDDNLDGIF